MDAHERERDRRLLTQVKLVTPLELPETPFPRVIDFVNRPSAPAHRGADPFDSDPFFVPADAFFIQDGKLYPMSALEHGVSWESNR